MSQDHVGKTLNGLFVKYAFAFYFTSWKLLQVFELDGKSLSSLFLELTFRKESSQWCRDSTLASLVEKEFISH